MSVSPSKNVAVVAAILVVSRRHPVLVPSQTGTSPVTARVMSMTHRSRKSFIALKLNAHHR